MSDLSDDVTMTPSEIQRQNAPQVLNLQGLSLSPSPWTEAIESSTEDRKTVEQQRRKRELLAQQRQEIGNQKAEKEAYERNFRAYMAMVAMEERQARTQGEPMDPDTLASTLHMGMDLISGGGIGSSMMSHGVEEVAKNGDGEERDEARQEKEATRAMPANPPLRNA